MLSARELDPSALGGGWVNERINFTHGVGAMTPVNEVTTEGSPRLIIRNLPPVSSEGAPEISEPRIYFGERPGGYIVVGARRRVRLPDRVVRCRAPRRAGPVPAGSTSTRR